jgi:hypothetical protein
MATYKVGYFVGSLASDSINRILSKGLIRLAPPKLEFLGIPIKNLPLYSHDYDEDSPEGRALKEALSSVDGLRPGILGADLRHAAAHRGVRHGDRGSMSPGPSSTVRPGRPATARRSTAGPDFEAPPSGPDVEGVVMSKRHRVKDRGEAGEPWPRPHHRRCSADTALVVLVRLLTWMHVATLADNTTGVVAGMLLQPTPTLNPQCSRKPTHQRHRADLLRIGTMPVIGDCETAAQCRAV